MTNRLSKTQIDRLGDRLRKGATAEADLRLLDEYRRSFSDSYNYVAIEIRKELDWALTGRPAKSTTSIIDKLRRESIRLSQIQDIAGCRIVVADLFEQQVLTLALMKMFPNASAIDRREKPSHGYRAVHVIPRHDGQPIEIQVRTKLQHLWAELSEKLADDLDPKIKYGGGPAFSQKILLELSEKSSKIDESLGKLAQLYYLKNRSGTDNEKIPQLKKFIAEQQRDLENFFNKIQGKGP